jgi:hypothetical protein
LVSAAQINNYNNGSGKMYDAKYFEEWIERDLVQKFDDSETLRHFIETEDNTYRSMLDEYMPWKKNQGSNVTIDKENYHYVFEIVIPGVRSNRRLARLARKFHCGPLHLDAVLESIDALHKDEKKEHTIGLRRIKESKSTLEFWTGLVHWAGSIWTQLDAEAVEPANVAYLPARTSTTAGNSVEINNISGSLSQVGTEPGTFAEEQEILKYEYKSAPYSVENSATLFDVLFPDTDGVFDKTVENLEEKKMLKDTLSWHENVWTGSMKEENMIDFLLKVSGAIFASTGIDKSIELRSFPRARLDGVERRVQMDAFISTSRDTHSKSSE